jgi:hypothetical protein
MMPLKGCLLQVVPAAIRSVRKRKNKTPGETPGEVPPRRPEDQDDTLASDHDEIKAIVEPYWHIFNFCLEHFETGIINSLTFTQPSANEPTDPTTVMLGCKATEDDDDLNFAQGARAYPPLLSLRLRAGALKFNMCDTSIVLFLRYIEYALWRTGAVTQWLTLSTKPRVVFHFGGVEPNPTVRHSVFGITSAHGYEFIADFTIEQFGFEPEMWFTTRKEYLAKVSRNGQTDTAKQEEIGGAMKRDLDVQGMRRVIQELCDDFDMAGWREVEGSARIDWVKRLVTDACEMEFGRETGVRTRMYWRGVE